MGSKDFHEQEIIVINEVHFYLSIICMILLFYTYVYIILKYICVIGHSFSKFSLSL